MNPSQAPTTSPAEASDTTMADVDQIDLLHLLTHQCLTLLGLDASGAMLANDSGALRVAATSSESSRLAPLFDPPGDGPWLDSYTYQLPVVETDLFAHPGRWPAFTGRALHAGIHAVHVLPLQVRGSTIGALGMFTTRTTVLTDHQVLVAEALANATAIALLSHRAAQKSAVLAAQLQTALSSRIVIEQAKGMLAQRGGVSLEHAFEGLRSYARNNRLKLADVCTGIVDGTCDQTRVLDLLPSTAVPRKRTPPRGQPNGSHSRPA